MAYPQGFLFQPSVSLALHSVPSFGSGVLLGPRTEELGRSAAGSAFAPYSGSSSSPGFSSHVPYGGEPRAAATVNSFVGPAFDPAGSLDFHPFGALPPYPYGDAGYRKNATRDATATLKAWLQEHRKNPYPTKGEKIMLAIITKMTLTQVSTWFANARRRLKKENKMTWTPRNRSEDEEDEDNTEPERNDDDEEHAETTSGAAARPPPSAGASCVLVLDDGSSSDTDRGFTDPDCRDSGARRPCTPSPPPKDHVDSVRGPSPPPKDHVDSVRGPSPPPKDHVDSVRGPNPPPKPKLWSLAEIATSSDRSRGCDESAQAARPPAPPGPPGPPGRHLYYTPPFIPGYSGYGPLGPLQGRPGSLAPPTHLNGLQQSLLQTAEARLLCQPLRKGLTDV